MKTFHLLAYTTMEKFSLKVEGDKEKFRGQKKMTDMHLCIVALQKDLNSF